MCSLPSADRWSMVPSQAHSVTSKPSGTASAAAANDSSQTVDEFCQAESLASQQTPPATSKASEVKPRATLLANRLKQVHKLLEINAETPDTLKKDRDSIPVTPARRQGSVRPLAAS